MRSTFEVGVLTTAPFGSHPKYDSLKSKMFQLSPSLSQLFTLTGQRLTTIISNWKTACKYIVLYSLVLIFCDRMMMTEFNSLAQPPKPSKTGKSSRWAQDPWGPEVDQHPGHLDLSKSTDKKKRNFIHSEGIGHIKKNHLPGRLLQRKKSFAQMNSQEEADMEQMMKQFENLGPEQFGALMMDLPLEFKEGGDGIHGLPPDKEELAKQIKKLREMEKKFDGKS